MSIAYWCVLVAAFLPLIWTITAKSSAPKFNNYKPRSWLDDLEGLGQRAHWAQLNSFEAFPPFAAAVIIASMVGKINADTLDYLAMGFIVFRVLFGIFYLANKANLRSLVWFAAVACWVSMFVLSA